MKTQLKSKTWLKLTNKNISFGTVLQHTLDAYREWEELDNILMVLEPLEPTSQITHKMKAVQSDMDELRDRIRLGLLNLSDAQEDLQILLKKRL